MSYKPNKSHNSNKTHKSNMSHMLVSLTKIFYEICESLNLVQLARAQFRFCINNKKSNHNLILSEGSNRDSYGNQALVPLKKGASKGVHKSREDGSS